MTDATDTSFLPEDYLARKAARRANLFCAAVFLAALAAVTVTFVVRERGLRRVEREADAAAAEYADAAKRIAQVQAMQARQAAMARRAELAAGLLEKVPRSYLLASITNALPPGSSLIDLSLQAKVRKPPAPAKTAYDKRKQAAAPPETTALAYDVTLKITGMADSDERVSDFLAGLKKIDLFEHTGGTETGIFLRDGRPLRKFVVEVALRPDAAVAIDRKTERTQLAGGEQ